MVSSRHYKEYPLMKKQDIERAHTGFIAGSVCSSATKQNFTSYNYPVGPWILCCEDKKSQKSMKTWGGNVTRALRRGDQDSRLRALLLVFDSVSEANLRCHIKHILCCCWETGPQPTFLAGYFVILFYLVFTVQGFYALENIQVIHCIHKMSL